MILRSYALRHGKRTQLTLTSSADADLINNPGRQAMPSLAGRSCIRAFSTDGQQPPFPTAFAEPPPPPPPTQDESASGIPDGTSPAQASPDEASPTRPTPAWQRPGGMSPMALWNKQKEITVDRRIAARHRRKEAIAKTTKPIGSVVHTRFEPSSLLRDPPRPEDVTLELLMASQTHMGHHTALWNPANQRYIYGVRDNIHIISLEETAAALRRAARVVEEVAYLGGLMLFVGNRKGQMEVIARAAELAGACHLFSKWVPGTITNRDQILGKQQLRVVDERDRPVEGFERLLLEKRPLLPDLVVIMNPLENFVMLHECAQENIPTIGLIDTDADPTRVTYTIPGNDDR